MENCRRNYCIVLIFSILSLLFMKEAAAVDVIFCEKSQDCHFVLLETNRRGELISEVLIQKDSIAKKKKSPKTKRDAKGKKVTFETFEQNYQKAQEFYDKQMFISAARLLEELYPLSLGTPMADTILYLFADCYYQNKDYEMAAYHFKEYANKYTSSTRAEDAYYKAILAISHLSPEYSLDQTETNYVIEEIQVFIRQFPYSSHMEECNELLDKMRDKLARKSYEILKLYYDTENYRSAQIVAKNFFKQYGGSQYGDDAYAILVRNNYEYARKSVEAKKRERYLACVEAFKNMRINYPGSDLLAEVQKYADDAQLKLQKSDSKEQTKSERKSRKDNNRTKNKDKNED